MVNIHDSLRASEIGSHFLCPGTPLRFRQKSSLLHFLRNLLAKEIVWEGLVLRDLVFYLFIPFFYSTSFYFAVWVDQVRLSFGYELNKSSVFLRFACVDSGCLSKEIIR